MERYDAIIVGAGPAGLSAAGRLARAGYRVIAVDSGAQPGGQLVKQIHKFFGSAQVCAGVRGIRLARKLYDEAVSAGCEFLLNAAAYSLDRTEEGYRVLADLGERTRVLTGKTVLLALGASENALAFPGWTKPGVITAGAAQTLVNLQRVRVGERVLMVGAGNVGLIVSYQLLQAGIDVAAVIEAAPKVGGYAVHAAKIRRAGVPIYTSHTILEAQGDRGVERAVIARVDERFEPIPGTEQTLDVDTICLAVGLSPLVKLACAGGCRVVRREGTGESVPWHDENLMTSLPGVFVAGDVAGVEEASIAMEEGAVAGCAIQAWLGGENDVSARAASEARLRELRAKSGEHRALGTDLSGYAAWPGARAVIECCDGIPCDPCRHSCPTGAIAMGGGMSGLPVLDAEKCVGCGKCVAACPGMACFLVNMNAAEGAAEITIPYEYLPLPVKGERVTALSREGEVLCRAEITRVLTPAGADCTALVSFLVPAAYAGEARAIDRKEARRQ